MSLTAGGASAGAAARPSGSSRARSPLVSGTPVGDPGPQSAGSATGEGVGTRPGAPPASWASRFAAPVSGGLLTRTGPDHSPSSYGIPRPPANCHHRSTTLGKPSTREPPSPKS